MNLGVLGGTAYTFYTKPHLRRDTRAIASTVAAALTLFGAEGFAAEKYRETPRGRREAEKAKKEGAALYRVAREHILRPGVLGGLLGVGESRLLFVHSTFLTMLASLRCSERWDPRRGWLLLLHQLG